MWIEVAEPGIRQTPSAAGDRSDLDPKPITVPTGPCLLAAARLRSPAAEMNGLRKHALPLLQHHMGSFVAENLPVLNVALAPQTLGNHQCFGQSLGAAWTRNMAADSHRTGAHHFSDGGPYSCYRARIMQGSRSCSEPWVTVCLWRLPRGNARAHDARDPAPRIVDPIAVPPAWAKGPPADCARTLTLRATLL